MVDSGSRRPGAEDLLGFAGMLLVAAMVGGLGLYGLADSWARGEPLVLGSTWMISILGFGAGVVLGIYGAVGLVSLAWARWYEGRNVEKGVFGVLVAALLAGGTLVGLEMFVESRRPSAEITAAAGSACLGHGVPGAGPVDRQASINQLVVVDLEGREHPWTGHAPIQWKPATLADVRLVACVAREEEHQVLETCPYEGGSDVTRYRTGRRVVVVEASSGARLDDVFMFGDPRNCQPTEDRSLHELYGELEWAEVEQHLSEFVERGR